LHWRVVRHRAGTLAGATIALSGNASAVSGSSGALQTATLLTSLASVRASAWASMTTSIALAASAASASRGMAELHIGSDDPVSRGQQHPLAGKRQAYPLGSKRQTYPLGKG
jgi:hypothetical protein